MYVVVFLPPMILGCLLCRYCSYVPLVYLCELHPNYMMCLAQTFRDSQQVEMILKLGFSRCCFVRSYGSLMVYVLLWQPHSCWGMDVRWTNQLC